MASDDDAMAEADDNARMLVASADSSVEAQKRPNVYEDDGNALHLPAEPSSSRPGTDRGSHHVSHADAELDDGTDAHEAEVLVLREDAMRFLQQINTLPTTLDVSTDEQQLDALSSVRMWTERLKRQRDSPADSTSDSVFVPLQVVIGDESGLFSVIPFQDGVYRGQVTHVVADDTHSQLDADAEDKAASPTDVPLIPHGFGVWTSADGSCRCGQWVQGEQTGVGTQQHRGVMVYEGEWKNDFPTGAGIGTFADGSSFVGQWVRGRPYGLGSLRIVEDQMTVTEAAHSSFGWLYGTQCLQPCRSSSEGEEQDNKAVQSIVHRIRSTVPLRFEDQPLRGLYVGAMRLEDWRIATFQRVLDHWRLVCCEQAVESAKQSRLLAMIAWQKAHVAQQKAIDAHILQIVEQRKRDDHELVQLTLKIRERHARMQHVRQFHDQRRMTAEFQCELARCCVDTQQETADLMESELSAIVNLLQEAKQAQADCSEYSHQLQVIKRQIENVSLKINDVRLRQERERLSAVNASANSGSAISRPVTSSIPGTPLLTALGAAKNSAKGILHTEQATTGGNQTERNVMVVKPDYVCDVPGCECGIPRDAFMRIGAALNGES